MITFSLASAIHISPGKAEVLVLLFLFFKILGQYSCFFSLVHNTSLLVWGLKGKRPVTPTESPKEKQQQKTGKGELFVQVWDTLR